MAPEPLESRFLLDWARDLIVDRPFIDFHTHPFDVFTGDTNYQVSGQAVGLYSKGSGVYRSPLPGADKPFALASPQASRPSTNAALLASRLAYIHTGPKVFVDQLDLAGIETALLLPVARKPGDAEVLLEAAGKMFLPKGRFLLGCPLPVGVPADKLDSFYHKACEAMPIHAIKIHPNLAAIDPLTQAGRQLIEASLVAAGSLNMPVLVHGGYSAGLNPREAGEFGTLSRLAGLDWSLSSAPVILAHAGCYGLAEQEVAGTLQLLNTLFDKHPNLLADTSGLALPILRIVLQAVDRRRLVFGSDALYFPVWRAWVTLLQALRQVSDSPDDDLIQIASTNPHRCLKLASQVFP